MWIYEKKLEYPVSIKTPNPKLALAIISQLGGPDCSNLRFWHGERKEGAVPLGRCLLL